MRITATWTAVFLPAVFGFAGYQLTRLLQGPDPVGFTIWFTVTIIALIMLHEVGHLIVGILFGLKADRITIGPWGATTRFVGNLGQIANRSHFVIALAGPIAQIVMSLSLIRIVTHFGVPSGHGFVAACIISVLMGAVNLLPVPGVDGWTIAKAGWRTLTGRGADPYLKPEQVAADA